MVNICWRSIGRAWRQHDASCSSGQLGSCNCTRNPESSYCRVALIWDSKSAPNKLTGQDPETKNRDITSGKGPTWTGTVRGVSTDCPVIPIQVIKSGERSIPLGRSLADMTDLAAPVSTIKETGSPATCRVTAEPLG
ncbi:hypothetical protein FKM82_021688 [Ascaphus truei]